MNTTAANNQHHDQWDGTEGQHWARHADRYDRMLAPFADQLATAAAVSAGERILDVGCGCGITTIEAAIATGPSGRAVGVDISPQMLETAAGRAAASGVADRTRFEVADADRASRRRLSEKTAEETPWMRCPRRRISPWIRR